jgi:RNAse (barnase) inhibitor barstar
MTSEAALFSEMKIQFKLPDYFGQNWDALDECLADLEWLPATFYVIAIDHAEQILESEKERTRQILSRLVQRIPEEWSHPIMDGEDWDRPAVPFHWVLCEQAQSDARLGLFSLDPESI